MVRALCCSKKTAICLYLLSTGQQQSRDNCCNCTQWPSVLRIASSVYSPETGSGWVVLNLKKGDNVWVRRLGHGRHIESHYNYFSGYLISAEI